MLDLKISLFNFIKKLKLEDNHRIKSQLHQSKQIIAKKKRKRVLSKNLE